MKKLGFGAVLLICVLLIGCVDTPRPSAGPPAPNQQPERGGGDGGGGGAGM